jgi:anti-anti-sigma factor
VSYKVFKIEGGVRVEVKGSFKRDLSQTLSETLEKLIAKQTPRIILDLAAVDFLDSNCLGLLIFSSKRIKAYGGQLCLQNPNGIITELLSESRLQRVLTILEPGT